MSEPIQFLNRYTGKVETETIYGEGYLRWVYGSPLGRAALAVLVKRAFFSKWYGWRMNARSSVRKIRPFIDQYEVDTNEFAGSVDDFASFNAFFYRHLRPEARPVRGAEGAVSFPSDGRHLAVLDWSEQSRFYVKGQSFDLSRFLGDGELSRRYASGNGLISRLCPTDYHRFHSPAAGRIVERRKISGSLASVSPIALRQRLGYLWENKRELLLIEAPGIGLVTYVAIGATCVGGIEFTRKVGDSVDRGEELGYFAFGGSCVATLFEPGRVVLDEDLRSAQGKGLELYARVGERGGVRRDPRGFPA